MKIRSKSISAAFVLLLLVSVPALTAQDLVILHTNDTHSQIEEIRVGRGAGAGGVHRRAEYFHQVISQYGRCLMPETTTRAHRILRSSRETWRWN